MLSQTNETKTRNIVSKLYCLFCTLLCCVVHSQLINDERFIYIKRGCRSNSLLLMCVMLYHFKWLDELKLLSKIFCATDPGYGSHSSPRQFSPPLSL